MGSNKAIVGFWAILLFWHSGAGVKSPIEALGCLIFLLVVGFLAEIMREKLA
jgi:hypothetical protein